MLTGVRISHGYWIDSIQGLASPFDLARHGGHGGSASTVALSPGEHLVRIYGLQGANPAVPAIARISFETSTGRTFGPYGEGLGQDPTTPFDYRVPARGRIVGFTHWSRARVPERGRRAVRRRSALRRKGSLYFAERRAAHA